MDHLTDHKHVRFYGSDLLTRLKLASNSCISRRTVCYTAWRLHTLAIADIRALIRILFSWSQRRQGESHIVLRPPLPALLRVGSLWQSAVSKFRDGCNKLGMLGHDPYKARQHRKPEIDDLPIHPSCIVVLLLLSQCLPFRIKLFKSCPGLETPFTPPVQVNIVPIFQFWIIREE